MGKEKYRTVRGYALQKKEKKMLTDSMEDYMEMIYRQCVEEGYTRINQVAEQLNVQPSSASKMVQRLTTLGLLNYEKYGIIHLTEKGKNIGNFLLYRHDTIKAFLTLLKVQENLLDHTEIMEHSINKEILERLDGLVQFFEEEKELKEKFHHFIK